MVRAQLELELAEAAEAAAVAAGERAGPQRLPGPALVSQEELVSLVQAHVTWGVALPRGFDRFQVNNRPCAQQYLGKSQSCMVLHGRLCRRASGARCRRRRRSAARGTIQCPSRSGRSQVISRCETFRCITMHSRVFSEDWHFTVSSGGAGSPMPECKAAVFASGMWRGGR